MAAFALLQRRLVLAAGARPTFGSLMAIAYTSTAISLAVPVVGSGLATAYSHQRYRVGGADPGRWRAAGDVPGHRSGHSAPRHPKNRPMGMDGVAPATRELVDTEARRIIEEWYKQALETLRGNRDRLDQLAHTLLQKENLDEAYAAAGVSRHTIPAAVGRSQAR